MSEAEKMETGFEMQVAPKSESSLTVVEQTKAISEIQSSLIIAKKFPRDETQAYSKIMKACERPILAQQAIYRLPIGGKVQEGPSIRLAEVMKLAWGNLISGIKAELGQGKSKCVAFCWDTETNTRTEIHFDVEHWIEVGQKGNKSKKFITDPNEISRLIANYGAKKHRDCILQSIPGDVIEAAMRACRATQKKGDGKPLADRIRDMVVAFNSLGVSQEMIEKKVGHKIELTTVDEAVELTAIFNSIRDGQAKRNEYFDFPNDDSSPTEKQSIIDKLKGKEASQKPQAAQPVEPPAEEQGAFAAFSKSTVAKT